MFDRAFYCGAFPALPTPFDKEGHLNPEPLAELVRDLILQGVTGFYALGSTGEGLLMTPDERKLALETILSEAKEEACVIAHVGSMSTAGALELAEHAAENGAAAISSVTPLYFAYSFEQIKAYYTELTRVGLPVLVYNIPALSGTKLTTDQLTELLEIPGVYGVKHTCQDYFQLERLRHARPDAVLYNGYDETFLSGIVMGADGGIGTTYNLMPHNFHAIMDKVAQGDIPGARKIQISVNNIVDALIKTGVMPGTKAVLTAQGYDFGNCRPPFTPADPKKVKILLQVCREEGILESEEAIL